MDYAAYVKTISNGNDFTFSTLKCGKVECAHLSVHKLLGTLKCSKFECARLTSDTLKCVR
jgi:hypothetical protein